MATDDRYAAEQVLATTTEVARGVFGHELAAVFALGSLAHGGFAPLASDIDIALVLNLVDQDTAESIAAVRRTSIARSSTPLAERLSIFWSDWHGVRHGAGVNTRLPAVDRLDLLDDGRLLFGNDERTGAQRPDRVTLIREGAQFACARFDNAYLDNLRRPAELVADGPRTATKAALFPIRLLYTLATGRIGYNKEAARWYARQGRYPALADAAIRGRENGISDAASAAAILQHHLVGLYIEFFDSYAAALTTSGHEVIARSLRERQQVLGDETRDPTASI